MRVHVIAILVLVLPAMALAPLEQKIHRERNRLRYGSAKAALTLHDSVSQSAWIALLAGFRGIVADFIWIQGHHYWETKQWLRQYRNMETTVTLQPLSVLFWDVGAWHMAWNIGYAERVATNNTTQAQGLKRERVWHEHAEAFLKRGIENIPNRYELYFKLGWLYEEKFKDDCRAAEYFAKAAAFPHVPSYISRMHARAQERCGDIKGAYRYWTNLWSQDHTKVDQQWNIVERELKRLEDLLNLPDDQRVFPKKTGATSS
jgi:hypothetical protein